MYQRQAQLHWIADGFADTITASSPTSLWRSSSTLLTCISCCTLLVTGLAPATKSTRYPLDVGLRVPDGKPRVTRCQPGWDQQSVVTTGRDELPVEPRSPAHKPIDYRG